MATVPSTLGYQGRDAKFGFVEISDGFRGPTNTHESVSTATSTSDNYHITNVDSGKIIPLTLPAASDITVQLPDPSAGTTFTFVVSVIGGAGADVVLTATGAHMIGSVSSLPTFVTAANATTATVDSSAAVGDTIVLTGISTTQWLVTGTFISDADITFA